MDDLTSEFLVETNESLDALDLDFVQLEKNPEDSEIINNIFRVMHTIKGTCGFLGLSRLEKVAHAAENIMDKLREKAFTVTPDIISLILEANDTIKVIIGHLEETEEEPAGDDTDLIRRLNECADTGVVPGAGGATPSPEVAAVEEPVDMPVETQGEDDKGQAYMTSDLDEEIEFEPVPMPETIGEVEESAQDSSLPEDEDMKGKAYTTSDLDEEIEFEPIPMPDTIGESAEAAEEVSATAEADEGDAIAEETGETVQDQAQAVPAVTPPAASVQNKALQKGLEVTEDSGAKKPTAGQSIRVSIDVLEDLMQMVGELVLTRNQLLQMTRHSSENNEFSTPLQRLNLITTELQEGVMKTRMQPIGNAWAKFPRLVRDLAHDLNKKIEIKMIGADTELDRQMLEAIKDPLTHMVRNSADHGIETPEDRAAAGKQDAGTVTLSAYHEGGHIIIKIADDGRGLNTERIKAKALENGLATAEELEHMSPKQLYRFIFNPGFSTAAQVTAVSGRGVGMDVVVSNIERIGGTVELDSWEGRGSEFVIKLPLTLAIMPVLIVKSGAETFAIPQIRVAEIVRVDEEDESSYRIETINGAPVLRIRGRLLPLLSVAKTLQLARDTMADNDNEAGEGGRKYSDLEPFIVVCEVGSQTIGLLVDQVFHTEEIVVKPIAPIMQNLEVYSGCTILGDGSVIMILDPNGLIKMSGYSDAQSERIEHDETRVSAAERVESFLTFNAWSPTPKAVPLELVARLEEIDASKVEWSGGKRVVQYRGGLMRLTTLDPSVEFPAEGVMEVIVFIDEKRIMGLVVEEILDIVKQNLHGVSSGGEAGLIGSIVIHEHTTDLLDISYIFSQIYGDWLGHNDAESLGGGSDTSQRHILLVDDSPFFRKFMKPVLVVAGFDVTAVESAADALELLQRYDNTIDLVVSDIDMPEMNGLEFIAACKADERLASLPYIALSSHEQTDIGDYREHGFEAFVTKSDRNRLVETITNILLGMDVAA